MRKLFLLLFLTVIHSAGAQNLVPNPSFEDYDTCPIGPASLPFPPEATTYLSGWYKPNSGSSDAFNACSPAATGVSVPANFGGYQEARTGSGYVGMILNPDTMSGGILFREYVQTELSSPLIAGHSYFASYWVCLSDATNGAFIGSTMFGIDQLGALFTEDYIADDLLTSIVEVPQIESPAGFIYTDTLNWQQVSGTFTAAGGESWVTIGAFAPPGSFAEEIVYEPEIFMGDICYYFCDDVCVLDLDGTPAETTSLDTILCSASGTELTGRSDGEAFLWDNGDTTRSRTVTAPGIYWVRSLDMDNCHMAVDTFHARRETLHYPVDLGNDTIICEGDLIEVNAYAEVFEQYEWNTGYSGAVLPVSRPGTYYVTATSGCYTGLDTIVIHAAPLPVAFLPEDTTVCPGTGITLGAPQEGMIYSWSTGSGDCCITVSDSGTYRLTVTNICGDQAFDEIKISYTDCENCILMPNAFSPNGDGINDVFSVTVTCPVKNYMLNIFNRWGQLVFSSVNPEKSWDGSMEGQRVDAGAYFYYLEAASPFSGKEIIRKGDITLIR